jgi:hypothetical protein
MEKSQMSAIKRPSLPLSGGCPCGAIRYEVSATPLLLYACHCTDCQRQSGSAFSMGMPVASQSFRITRGQPRDWHRVGTAGVRTTSWFCGECAGRIYGERDGLAGRVNIRAGTLDDTSWLRPVGHYFMRSAQPWEKMSADADCFETLPDDNRALLEKWRNLWQL